MASKPPIPNSENDLSAGWLHQVMRAGGNAAFPAIRDVAVEQIGVGVGMVGTILRCRLTYFNSDAGPESLIVKLPSSHPPTLQAAQTLQLYRREYDYYRRLAHHVPIRSPALRYSDFDASDHRFVLVLEDLGAMSTIDQVDGASPEQAKTAILAIARMHGHYWDQVNRPPVSLFNDPANSRRPKLTQSIYQTSLPVALQRFGSHFTDSMRRLAEQYGQRLAEHRATVASGPQTFTHGDYRLDNMLFGSDAADDDFAVVDWQVCGISSGLYDVAYFLSSSVDPPVRRQIERDALAEYHDVVREMGAAGFTREECWLSYRRNMLSCLITPIIAGSRLDFPDARSQRLADVFLQRTLTAIDDLDAREFLPAA